MIWIWVDRQITEEDLRKLEMKMNELAKQNNIYIRKEIPKQKPYNIFRKREMNINWICCKI